MPPFPAQSTSYEPTIAWWLATCSSLTYNSKPEIIQQLESLGFCDVTFFEFLGTFGYIARHHGYPPGDPFAILVFRGTENDYTNILTDVEIIKRPVSDQNLRVHGGFLTALQEVWGTSSVLQQTAPYFLGVTPVLKVLEMGLHGPCLSASIAVLPITSMSRRGHGKFQMGWPLSLAYKWCVSVGRDLPTTER